MLVRLMTLLFSLHDGVKIFAFCPSPHAMSILLSIPIFCFKKWDHCLGIE